MEAQVNYTTLISSSGCSCDSCCFRSSCRCYVKVHKEDRNHIVRSYSVLLVSILLLTCVGIIIIPALCSIIPKLSRNNSRIVAICYQNSQNYSCIIPTSLLLLIFSGWLYVIGYIVSALRTSRLCQHNFEYNRSLKALSILPA